MKQRTDKPLAEIYEYIKGQVNSIHAVSELYADNPEEGIKQIRTLLTSAQQYANQFESEHLTPSELTEPVRKTLDMQKQLFGDKTSDDLIT